MDILKFKKKFEKATGYKIILISKVGSHLFGTNNEKSDIDYKGVFIPSQEDLILHKDLKSWTNNTKEKGKAITLNLELSEFINKTEGKNRSSDIDIKLISIHNLFKDLAAGDTGAIDLIFSINTDQNIFKDKIALEILKNKDLFISKKIYKFIDYCLSQSKKYGEKGERFNEAKEFKIFWDKLIKKEKIGDSFLDIENHIKEKKLKYIKIIKSKTTGNKNGLYLEILNKRFLEQITVRDFNERFKIIENSFGDRTKEANKGLDNKSLSHAVRVIFEVEELLLTGEIKFPLKNKYYIKKIKEGLINKEEINLLIKSKIEKIKSLLLKSQLKEEVNLKEVNNFQIKIIKETFND